MNSKDIDFLALLLEELKTTQEPQSQKWIIEKLMGSSYRHVKKQLKRQLPPKYPLWLKNLLLFFTRFQYKKKQNKIKRRLPSILSYAIHEGLISEESKRMSRLYGITSQGQNWLEEEYSSQKKGIEHSELQASYDALKVCQTLQSIKKPLSHSKLQKQAFPKTSIPENANQMLKATLNAHNASIPEAFERAIEYAEAQQWIEKKNNRWYLTQRGKSQ